MFLVFTLQVSQCVVCDLADFWDSVLVMFLIKLNLCVAYLMGCPIRGVILDPFVALRMGIQGQVHLSLILVLGYLSFVLDVFCLLSSDTV
jgi:hypothetical protein